MYNFMNKYTNSNLFFIIEFIICLPFQIMYCANIIKETLKTHNKITSYMDLLRRCDKGIYSKHEALCGLLIGTLSYN